MPPDRTTRTLEDFLGLAAAADRLVARGRAAYDSDEMLRLAAESLLHKLGEAVARLDREDPDFIASHPEIRWRPMKAIRNLVAHDYGAIDYVILWNTLHTSLPIEARLVQSALDARRGSGSDLK